MDGKIIAIIAVAAVVIGGGAAAAIVLTNNNGKDSSIESTDASQIAASFSKNYSGFFGADFYLADGATATEAKAYYPNGSTSGYGSDSNFVKFHVYGKESEAKDAFNTNKEDYKNTIGTSAMGAERVGVEIREKLTDAIGYYSNVSMGTPFTYLYYTGYEGNAFFESYIYLKNTTLSNTDEVKTLANSIYDAIEHPVSTDQAKKYTTPTPTPAPTPTYSGVALRCYNFTDEALLYGSKSTEYAMTSDSTAMHGKLQTADEKYYVEMQIVVGGAHDTYQAVADEISGKIGTELGSTGVYYIGITEKTGVEDGIGLYYNASGMGGGVYIYEYTCYNGSYFAHAYLRSATAITGENATAFATAVITALTESLS